MNTNIFDTIKWKKNYNRKKVVDGGCYSMTFGLINRPYHGYQISKSTNDYPDVYSYLKQIVADKNFKYTSITLNKNIICKPHKDQGNKGLSLIIGLGDYTGGELVVNDHKHDINKKWLYFNGSEHVHYTLPFNGTRYTIIYYNVK